MDRKIKIMGIYIGLLFFVSILLILITSFSNTKIDPSYEVEENEKLSLDITMEQSVTKLTETNQKLNDKVSGLNEEINRLEKELYEKNDIIKEYEKKYNEDYINFEKAIAFYISGNINETKKTMELVNRDNLDQNTVLVYDNLLNKLK